ncbi:hypothetical protein PYW07_007181 [Mythimna separata]|uniref:Hornerin-like n=1 Tax=Mythimna separata TaxID=271217 RepID=A0AAD7Z2J1_MYTSE|nr:hypothetical protein PYW07_007181 [Mythimna separata]
MMELSCALVLISASLVIASPHGYGGYGVKGGASARAEASASAGAFGGVPVPAPLGVGYSGSFSKSSSSSSASSSASSSSSSSSFSYGGSGAGGFGLESGVPNQGGCSTGNCHTGRSHGVPTSYGSSPQGYNSANAAASAEAGAVSGLGCQGLSCGANSDKCKSGQCKPHTGTTPSNSDPNKCKSGQCGPSSDKGATPTDYDSNDIRVSAHNANDQQSGIETSSSAYDADGSDCSHGKCGPSGSSNSKLDYGSDFGNSYHGSNKQGSNADTETSQYQKPSSHLETPKLESKCKYGNCHSGPAESGHEGSPSSYNVPIHGAYENGNPKPCDGVKCENQPKGSYSPTDNTVTKGPSSFDYPSSLNCEGSGCFGIPANQATNRPSHTVSPSNVQFGYSPSKTPTSPAGVAPGHVGQDKPSDDNKLSKDKLPAYTGGFGGPAGLLKPNEYDFSAPPGSLSHGPASSHNGKPLEGASTGCNTPSCSGNPSASRPTGGPVSEGTYNLRPGGDIPSGKLPNYTGGLGPAGILKPNEFDVHGTVANKPNYAHIDNPLSNTQQPGCKPGQYCGGSTPTAGGQQLTGNGGTQGCKPGQYCGGYTPTAGQLPTDNTGAQGCKPGQYCGGSTPTAGGQQPTGNGGTQGCKPGQYCGGYTPTAGQLPTDNTGAHGCKPGQYCGGSTPTVGGQQPTGNGGTQGCKPGQYCGGSTPTVGGQQPTGNGGAQGCKPGQYCGGYTPTAGQLPTDNTGGQGCKPGQYCGGSTPTVGGQQPTGNGGAQGCKPGQYCGESTPTAGHLPTGNAGTQGCKPGQYCGGYTPTAGTALGATAPSGYYGTTKPHTGTIPGPAVIFNPDKYYQGTGPSSPGYTPSETFNTPTSSDYPSFGGTAAPHTPAQPYGDTKPSSGSHLSSVTLPAYTHDYDRPSGVHRPSDISGPASTPSFTHTQSPSSLGGHSTDCKTGNCANYPTSGQPGSFGVTKPNTNVNTASSQYSGGFGGPSGTFKPTEHNYVTPSTGSAPTNCETPNCVGSPSASADATSGANAQSGSYGITKPSGGNNPSNKNPTYTGGFGGAAGLLKPNEYAVPAVSPKPNNKPTGVPTAACLSGNCGTQPPHGSAQHIDNASSGAHATAAAAATADAVAYSGGFGGPPGVLTPYDDGKVGALPANGGHAHGPQTGGAYGSHNANIHSQHGKVPVATGGPSGPSGVHENTGAQAGSVTGATAYAGAVAGASAGVHGYNPHGSHDNHEGNIKGSPCSSGCGGSPSGAAAKSLSGANAFGLGGSYASSSASAHASAGAYTKGGYGKR